MKQNRTITVILLLCASLKISAQNTFSKNSYIASYALQVTTNKTTNLVFPAAITSVDRGSQDILVQKATGVENILRIKADVKDFSETSLSIITADGKLYSFVVDYCSQPSYLNINVSKVDEADTALKALPVKDAVIYSAPGMNKAALTFYADSILNLEANIHTLHTYNSKIAFSLHAMYVHEDVMFFKFAFTNYSHINYDIDQLHFYIQDRIKSERTASQQIEIHPLSIFGDTAVIRGESKIPWVVALPKFTIPDGKYLSIEIMEKNGGRNLSLVVKNRKIMKAKSI